MLLNRNNNPKPGNVRLRARKGPGSKNACKQVLVFGFALKRFSLWRARERASCYEQRVGVSIPHTRAGNCWRFSARVFRGCASRSQLQNIRPLISVSLNKVNKNSNATHGPNTRAGLQARARRALSDLLKPWAPFPTSVTCKGCKSLVCKKT